MIIITTTITLDLLVFNNYFHIVLMAFEKHIIILMI